MADDERPTVGAYIDNITEMAEALGAAETAGTATIPEVTGGVALMQVQATLALVAATERQTKVMIEIHNRNVERISIANRVIPRDFGA